MGNKTRNTLLVIFALLTLGLGYALWQELNDSTENQIKVTSVNDLIIYTIDIAIATQNFDPADELVLSRVANDLNLEFFDLHTTTNSLVDFDPHYYPCGTAQQAEEDPDVNEQEGINEGDTTKIEFGSTTLDLPGCCECPKKSLIPENDPNNFRPSNTEGQNFISLTNKLIQSTEIKIIDGNGVLIIEGNTIDFNVPIPNSADRAEFSMTSIPLVNPNPSRKATLEFTGTVDGKLMRFGIFGEWSTEGWMGKRQLKYFSYQL